MAEMQINMYFGFRNQFSYKIGDEIQWVPRREPQNGGRPPNGDMNGDAWMECPICSNDSYLLVEIRSDRIVAVKANDSNKPFVR